MVNEMHVTLVDGVPVVIAGGAQYCPWTGERVHLQEEPREGGGEVLGVAEPGFSDVLALTHAADDLVVRSTDKERYGTSLAEECKTLMSAVLQEDARMAYKGPITELYVRAHIAHRPSPPRLARGATGSLYAAALHRSDVLRRYVRALDRHNETLERIHLKLVAMRMSQVDNGRPIDDFDDIDF